MEAGTLADDLSVLCNFEIVSRNVLAWKSEARGVMAMHTDLVPGLGIAVVDATLSDIERLVPLVAELRSMLAAETSSHRWRR